MRTSRIAAFLMPGMLLMAIATPQSSVAEEKHRRLRAGLTGFNEVPAVSTQGHGLFRARFSDEGESLVFELRYTALEGSVTAAHIHLGQKDVNGGVIAFLCSNGADPNTQPCPQSPGTVTGTLTANDIIGPAGQGITPGEFEEFRRAVRRGQAYVNVHTSPVFVEGEIRGQIILR